MSAVRDLRNNMHFSHLQIKECFIGIFKNQNEQGNSKDYIKKIHHPRRGMGPSAALLELRSFGNSLID